MNTKLRSWLTALRQAWRARCDDWRSVAERRFLRRAVDASDLERRQRLWEREESSAYSLTGWS